MADGYFLLWKREAWSVGINIYLGFYLVNSLGIGWSLVSRIWANEAWRRIWLPLLWVHMDLCTLGERLRRVVRNIAWTSRYRFEQSLWTWPRTYKLHSLIQMVHFTIFLKCSDFVRGCWNRILVTPRTSWHLTSDQKPAPTTYYLMPLTISYSWP